MMILVLLIFKKIKLITERITAIKFIIISRSSYKNIETNNKKKK